MKKQISLSELDSLIRKNIQEKGLGNGISEEKFSEIKNKIKKHLMTPSANLFSADFDNNINETQSPEPQMYSGQDIELPIQTTQSPIVQQTVENPEAKDLAKKEGAIETKEQFLQQKEEELRQREERLIQKEQELSYKPQIPNFVEKAEPEKLFIFNTNELSLGSESLMKMPYRLLENPEEKKSMHDLWLEKGKVRAEIYQVEFKRIGDMIFKPLDGVCKFEERSSQIPSNIPMDDRDSVKQAIMSQQPTEPMLDSTEPITDVILPMTQDMGLNAPDVAAVMQNFIEKALKDYLINKSV